MEERKPDTTIESLKWIPQVFRVVITKDIKCRKSYNLNTLGTLQKIYWSTCFGADQCAAMAFFTLVIWTPTNLQNIYWSEPLGRQDQWFSQTLHWLSVVCTSREFLS